MSIKVQMKDLPKDRRIGFGESSLNYCRELLRNGVDPKTKLEVYREDILCLTIKSIEEGSKWTVRWPDDPKGRIAPFFSPYVKFTPRPNLK